MPRYEVRQLPGGLMYGHTPESAVYTFGTYVTPDHLCPDLLRYEQIGAADNWRGRVVRAFFWAMRAWKV